MRKPLESSLYDILTTNIWALSSVACAYICHKKSGYKSLQFWLVKTSP